VRVLLQALVGAMGAGVHEGISTVHIRIAELAELTASAADEKVR
jgi:hypothetical protein